MLNRLNILH